MNLNEFGICFFLINVMLHFILRIVPIVSTYVLILLLAAAKATSAVKTHFMLTRQLRVSTLNINRKKFDFQETKGRYKPRVDLIVWHVT